MGVMYSCTIIGITDSQCVELSAETLAEIGNSTVFTGGRRHYELVAPFLPEPHTWIDIVPPLDDVFRQYEKHGHVVAFASGDPWFFGFAQTVRTRCPQCEIRVIPTFNSLQLLSHRLGISYQTMRNVSLTGRPWNALDETLIRGEKLIGILTDRNKTPHEIYRHIQEWGYKNYELFVGARLGSNHELVEVYNPATQYDNPNCVVARMKHHAPIPFGIADNEFLTLEGRPNMITKMPVRLATIAALELETKNVFWDVGACTASVSIEAKRLFPHLAITVYERREECHELMLRNMRHLRTPGIDIVIGDFLDIDTKGLTPPDAVFLGGYGGKMRQFVEKLHSVLQGGCIVFNSVSEQSQREFMELTTGLGMRCKVFHTISVDQHNPITILKAE